MEWLPWLNLLVPVVIGQLWAISSKLGALAATQAAHGARLDSLEDRVFSKA